MPRLEIYAPIKPLLVIQPFGGNPAYYARFIDTQGNPYKGHTGTDLKAAHATPLLSPCDGMAKYVSDAHGGDGIYIQPHGTYDYKGGQAYAELIHWHLCSKDDPQYKPLIPTDGGSYPVKLGQLLGYTDNSGAPFESSGDHLHWGLLFVGVNGLPISPGNGFGGCEDIMPYWNGKYAEDAVATQAVIATTATVVTNITKAPISTQDKISLLSKVAQLLTTLLHVFKLE
jgi:hypothetical protein